MRCLYCGNALGLLKELTDREFCSREHQEGYKRLTDEAFLRLTDEPPEPAVSQPPQRTLPEGLPPPAPLAGQLVFDTSSVRPLSFGAPAVRMPGLQAVPDSPALPAKGKVMEELVCAKAPTEPVACAEVPIPVRQPVGPRSTGLRIVDIRDSRGPQKVQSNLRERLVRLWTLPPAYVRFAAAPASVMLLLWALAPVVNYDNLLESRWSRIQAAIRQRAAIQLSEDFIGGMAAWAGQGDWTRSWRIEKGDGARLERLALYQPSMQMRDYRMEFLVQIEQGAVGWVYRASGVDNYYAAKIHVVRPGPLPMLSLVRYSVIHGRQGPRVEIPIRVAVAGDRPYRVQLAVNGQDFSTSVEGQLVDFWRDGAHRAGGFGFFSDRGERARVYCLKLSHQDDFLGRMCAYFDPLLADPKQGPRSSP